MPDVTIALPPSWQRYARAIARRRQDTAPRRQAHGCEGGYAEHLSGAYGETAFGLWLYRGRPFTLTVGTYRDRPDFPRTEVRTRTRAEYDLIVRRDDNPAAAYVLVLPARQHEWQLAGWIWGRDARRDSWLAAHGGREPAWFVPAGQLQPMGTYRAGVAIDPWNGPWVAHVRDYLALCAATPGLKPKYHPTVDGALKMIPHDGDKVAAEQIRDAWATVQAVPA